MAKMNRRIWSPRFSTNHKNNLPHQQAKRPLVCVCVCVCVLFGFPVPGVQTTIKIKGGSYNRHSLPKEFHPNWVLAILLIGTAKTTGSRDG